MNDRLDTVERLAEDDPYWRGYRDGLRDRRNVAEAAQGDPQD